MPSLFSGRGAEGWHAPAGRRTCEPRPLVQDGQIRPAVPVGAIKTWDPADRSFRRTTRAASAESEVRPGPRLPTLRPHHLKTGEAGPEALPTLSLPTLRVCPDDGSVQPHAADRPVMGVAGSTFDGYQVVGRAARPGGVFFVLHIQLKVGSVYTSTCRYTKHPSLPDVRARQPATPHQTSALRLDARTPRQYSRVPAPAATCAGCVHRATAVSWLAVIIEGCGGFPRVP